MNLKNLPWIVRRFNGKAYVMDSLPDVQGRCVANIIAGPSTNPAWEEIAPLLAAAPRMLAALNRADGFVSSFEKKLGDWDAVDRAAIEAIRRAIADATGTAPTGQAEGNRS